jgi:hypothetical protein
MFGSASEAGADLASQVETTILTLPQALEPNSANWCTWGPCSLGPRLYHAPLDDGGVLIGWTDSSGHGHVSVVSDGTIQTTHNFTDSAVKGLVAHQGGGFAIMLWQNSTDTLRLSKRATNGSEEWSASLNHSDPETVFHNNIGDSRLAFGNGKYAAYYAVDCSLGFCAGHSGDQFKWVSDSGVVTTRWSWGCSHSMAALVDYHPGWDTITGLCSSDCYPEKGLNADRVNSIFVADANCAGSVALQLGQMAAGDSTWKVAFNAMDAECCDAHGVGLASFDASYQASVVWLTDTNGVFERDPVLARLRDDGTSERFLIGWRTASDADFHLGIINGDGVFLTGPNSVGDAGIAWGERDDSFRRHSDGSVTWVQGNASSSTLRLFRFHDGPIFSDGFETLIP